MRKRHVLIAAAVAVTLAGGAVAGLALARGSDGPTLRLVYEEDNGPYLKLGDTKPDVPRVMGLTLVCTTAPGVVEITGVEPVSPTEPSGLLVTAFAAHSVIGFIPAQLGSGSGTLTENGWKPGGPQPVSTVCDDSDPDQASAVAIELHRTADASVRVDSWRILWRTGREEGEVVVRYKVSMCKGSSDDC